MLQFTSSSDLLTIFYCQDLAFDLSLAALLGDNIYNFGELLAHPIVSNSLVVMNSSVLILDFCIL